MAVVLGMVLLCHVSMLSAVELPHHDGGSSVVTCIDVVGGGSCGSSVVPCLNVISSGTTPS